MIAKDNIKLGRNALDDVYSESDGLFYTLSSRKHFLNEECCRELFHYCWRSQEYIAFSTESTKSADRFNQFIDFVENRLKLKERTLVYKIPERLSVFIIKVPLFWRKCAYKRQIYTLFLRCGALYNTRNINNLRSFKRVLQKYHLTRAITIPLMYFMSGHVNFRSRIYYGIVDTFIHHDAYAPQNLRKDWKRVFVK